MKNGVKSLKDIHTTHLSSVAIIPVMKITGGGGGGLGGGGVVTHSN